MWACPPSLGPTATCLLQINSTCCVAWTACQATCPGMALSAQLLLVTSCQEHSRTRTHTHTHAHTHACPGWLPGAHFPLALASDVAPRCYVSCFQTSGNAQYDFFSTTPAVGPDNTVYIVASSGILYALNGTSGVPAADRPGFMDCLWNVTFGVPTYPYTTQVRRGVKAGGVCGGGGTKSEAE
jgi:hypothetical protein